MNTISVLCEPIIKIVRWFLIIDFSELQTGGHLGFEGQNIYQMTKNDIRNEFSDPTNHKNDILHIILGQPITKLISTITDGGHFGFSPVKKLSHIFPRGMGAKICY